MRRSSFICLMCAVALVLCCTLQSSAASKRVELRLLTYTNPVGNDVQKEIIAEFERRNPNIKVTIEDVPWRELFRRIAISVASDDPPDILHVDGPLVASYAHMGVLLPLDQYFTQKEIQAFVAPSVQEGSYKGVFYAAPERQSALGVFYNVEMMKKAGITPPSNTKDGWTWAQALDVAKKLTRDQDGDGRNDVWGLVSGKQKWQPYQVSTFHRSNGAPGSKTFLAISPDGTTVSGYLDSEETIEALQFYQDLHAKWKVTPENETPDMFENGMAAMLITPNDEAGKLASFYPDFKWGVTPMPYMKTPFTHTGSLHYAVASKSRNPKEAAMFIKFLTIEMAKKTYEGYKQLPAVKALYDELPEYQSAPLKIYYDSMVKWGHPRVQSIGYREYEEVLYSSFKDISLGADVRKTMKAAVAKINAELSKYFK
ncbi:MAG: ABC transporter substrate-binding protein [Bacillota bacterium]|jgi:fructooligosaccharide transport system substrate-binding protein